ncbi:hypothetical protein SNEBB_005837 [Seison nebaliae]|nr:hypothetical protein SNEBB_005837 [Seison nebaliae]
MTNLTVKLRTLLDRDTKKGFELLKKTYLNFIGIENIYHNLRRSKLKNNRTKRDLEGMKTIDMSRKMFLSRIVEIRSMLAIAAYQIDDYGKTVATAFDNRVANYRVAIEKLQYDFLQNLVVPRTQGTLHKEINLLVDNLYKLSGNQFKLEKMLQKSRDLKVPSGISDESKKPKRENKKKKTKNI